MRFIVLMKNKQVFGVPIMVTDEQLLEYRRYYRNQMYSIRVVSSENAQIIEDNILQGIENREYRKRYDKSGLPPMYPIDAVYATDNNQG